MSGHNKWSKIKHKKTSFDAEKSKIFSKVVKLITAEAKKAAGNKESLGLKSAIEKAKQVNMPKENIENAIKRAGSSQEMERITYETYGPGGAALIIEVLTGNRNKTAVEVKHILSKYNLSLAEPGSAVWAFERKGNQWIHRTTITLSEKDRSELENIVKDLEDNEEIQEVFTNVA